MANGLPDNYESGPVNQPQVQISPVTVLPDLTGEQAVDQAASTGFDPDTADSPVNPDNITFEDQPVDSNVAAQQRRETADKAIKDEASRQQLIEQTAPSGADAVASTGDPELDGLVNETVQGAEAVAREHGERVREDQRRAVNELMNQQEQAAITQEITAIAGPAGGYMTGEAFKGYNTGHQAAKGAAQKMADAELAAAGIMAEGAKQREAIEKSALADIEKQTAPIKSQITQTLRNIAQADADVRNGRVAPNRVWNNMETWRKVAVTAGAAMANVLSVRLGKGLPAQNPVLAELDKTIQNDIRGQEIELNRLFRTAGHERANLQSLQFQADKIRANILGNKALKVSSVIVHMESELATKVLPDKVRAAMLKNISELEKLRAGFYADMGKTAGQMYQRAVALSAKNVGQRIRGGGGGGPKPGEPPKLGNVLQSPDVEGSIPLDNFVGTTAQKQNIVDRWSATENSLYDLGRLISLIDQTGGAERFDPTSSWARLKGTKGSKLNNAYVRTIQNMVYANSGKQINEKEFELFKSRIPVGVTVREMRAPLIEEASSVIDKAADDLIRMGPGDQDPEGQKRVEAYAEAWRKTQKLKLQRMKPTDTSETQGSESGAARAKAASKDPAELTDGIKAQAVVGIKQDQYNKGKNAAKNRKTLVAEMRKNLARLKAAGGSASDIRAAQKAIDDVEEHFAETPLNATPKYKSISPAARRLHNE